MKQDLIIWMPNGYTLKFENVKKLVKDEDYINFVYGGVATGKTRDAWFLYDNIAGWALSRDVTPASGQTDFIDGGEA
ncbi:hypothetical protein LM010_10205 [Lacticaseibacillus manihotivorans]|nr:hypothetical protein LM010_10205 [Lacticaseibacillus manihotivorans]